MTGTDRYTGNKHCPHYLIIRPYCSTLFCIKKNIFCVTAAPYPTGQPMVAALEGTNITLTCTELKSLPPAKTVWQRGVKQEPIIPSSKYIVKEEGPNLSLTIVNATSEDQGVYFCWSENVLAARELEVYLTIRCK